MANLDSDLLDFFLAEAKSVAAERLKNQST
jgi:hypothetical protein